MLWVRGGGRWLGMALLVLLAVLMGTVAMASGDWQFSQTDYEWSVPFEAGQATRIDRITIDGNPAQSGQPIYWSLRHVSGNACELIGSNPYENEFVVYTANMKHLGTVVYRLSCDYAGKTQSTLITVHVEDKQSVPQITVGKDTYHLKVGEAVTITPKLLPEGMRYSDKLVLDWTLLYDFTEPVYKLDSTQDSITFSFAKPGYYCATLLLRNEHDRIFSRANVNFVVSDAQGIAPEYKPIVAQSSPFNTAFDRGSVGTLVSEAWLENPMPNQGKASWSLARVNGNAVTLELKQRDDYHVGAYLASINGVGTTVYDLLCTVDGKTGFHRIMVTVVSDSKVPERIAIEPALYRAKAGQTIGVTFEPMPVGSVLPAFTTAKLSIAGENEKSVEYEGFINLDTKTFSIFFNQAGYYSGYITLENHNLTYKIPVSFLISNTDEPDDTTITLRRLATQTDQVEVGRAVTYDLDVQGYKAIQEITFTASDKDGNVVARQDGKSTSFSFIPVKPGNHTVRARVLAEGATAYLQIDSAPLLVTGDPLPHTLTLASVSASATQIHLGQDAAYTAHLQGEGTITSLAFVAYDAKGAEVARQETNAQTFTFTPQATGTYTVRAILTIAGKVESQQKDAPVLTVIEPIPEKATMLRSITGPKSGALGDSLEYQVYITGNLADIRQMVYVVYDAAGNEETRRVGISGEYIFQPKAAGTYVVRAFMLTGEDNAYQYVDSQPVVISSSASGEKTQLQSITGPRAGAVGDSLTYGVYITGPLKAITEMVYVVYDATGTEVTRRAGISGEYTFKPQEAGIYVVRAFMKASGESAYQYVDSAPVTISGPAPAEKTVLRSVTGPKAGAVGEGLVYQVHITGSLEAITQMVYVVYDTTGTEVIRRAGISGEYTFKPQAAGEYIVRAFMQAKGENDYQYVDSALLTVSSLPPVEKAKLRAVTGPTAANVGDRLTYQVYITGELSTIAEMAYVVYDGSGVEVARTTGIAGEFTFIPSGAGHYVVRAFIKAAGDTDYQMADSVVLNVAAPESQQEGASVSAVVPTVEPVAEPVPQTAEGPQVEAAVEPQAEVVAEPTALNQGETAAEPPTTEPAG